MSEKKPPPLIQARSPQVCPVCGENSYSRAGIHPQCSVRQADVERKVRLKRDRLLAEETKKAALPARQIERWQKLCPKCDTLEHVRKTICRCGHAFTVRAGPSVSEGDQT